MAFATVQVQASLSLQLDTRSGDSAMGWQLEPVEQVPRALADVHLFSSDCGARGRWVELHTSHGVEVCVRRNAESVDAMALSTEDCWWTSSLEVGGSDGPFVGVAALVRRGQRVLGRLRVSRSTTLAERWYEEEPIKPFAVELEYLAQP